jgi:hypothetical protein
VVTNQPTQPTNQPTQPTHLLTQTPQQNLGRASSEVTFPPPLSPNTSYAELHSNAVPKVRTTRMVRTARVHHATRRQAEGRQAGRQVYGAAAPTTHTPRTLTALAAAALYAPPHATCPGDEVVGQRRQLPARTSDGLQLRLRLRLRL